MFRKSIPISKKLCPFSKNLLFLLFLNKNEKNGAYEAPEWLIDILYKLNIDAAFSSDFNAFIITVDDFYNNPIIKRCWNHKMAKNITDLKEKFNK